MAHTSLLLLIALLCLLAARCYSVLPCFKRTVRQTPLQKHRPQETCSLCVILGSGGHTTEMLRMMKTLPPRFTRRHYVVAESDLGSKGKAIAFETSRGAEQGIDYFIEMIPRARQVHQSYLTTPISFLRASVASLGLLHRIRPSLILSNGPGTALPVLLLAFLPRIVMGASFGPRLIYVESWARVRTLSLTGKLSWWFVDRFLVQWPFEGLKGVEFIGRVV
ncbi:asparagine-linked glycosylation 14 [Geranomyces variabilis]|nr:asparagine-linked glycosylation 14 [Geranomyces variabilis]